MKKNSFKKFDSEIEQICFLRTHRQVLLQEYVQKEEYGHGRSLHTITEELRRVKRALYSLTKNPIYI